MCRFILSTTAAHLHHALQPTSTPVPLHWLKDVSLVIGVWSLCLVGGCMHIKQWRIVLLAYKHKPGKDASTFSFFKS